MKRRSLLKTSFIAVPLIAVGASVPIFAETFTAYAAPNPWPSVNSKTKDADLIILVRQLLHYHGYSVDLPDSDGSTGDATNYAGIVSSVKDFQLKAGFSKDVSNGNVGDGTWKVLIPKISITFNKKPITDISKLKAADWQNVQFATSPNSKIAKAIGSNKRHVRSAIIAMQRILQRHVDKDGKALYPIWPFASASEFSAESKKETVTALINFKKKVLGAKKPDATVDLTTWQALVANKTQSNTDGNKNTDEAPTSKIAQKYSAENYLKNAKSKGVKLEDYTPLDESIVLQQNTSTLPGTNSIEPPKGLTAFHTLVAGIYTTIKQEPSYKIGMATGENQNQTEEAEKDIVAGSWSWTLPAKETREILIWLLTAGKADTGEQKHIILRALGISEVQVVADQTKKAASTSLPDAKETKSLLSEQWNKNVTLTLRFEKAGIQQESSFWKVFVN